MGTTMEKEGLCFDAFNFDERIQKGIDDLGLKTPTPVQQQAIPAVLSGQDVRVSAPTGTGKTLVFLASILERFVQEKTTQQVVRALVLVPTRELAVQVHERAQAFAKCLPFKSVVVYGGVRIGGQIDRLRRRRELLVATPGRLLDLVEQGAVRLNQVEMFVLDEADRMLDMGFMPDIQRIMNLLPKKRQNLLFSATFSSQMKAVAQGLLNDPMCIDVAQNTRTPSAVKQVAHPVDPARKTALLSHLIGQHQWMQVLVFTKTKRGADRLANQLSIDGWEAAAIHGDLSQAKRNRTLLDFKKNKSQVLVATDVAARGLDVEQLPCVVNYDLPQVAEDYVHRIGRTGRAGNSGLAVSLVTIEDTRLLSQIERYLQGKIASEEVVGFEPDPKIKAKGAGNKRKGRSSRKGADRQTKGSGSGAGSFARRGQSARDDSGKKPWHKKTDRSRRAGESSEAATRRGTASSQRRDGESDDRAPRRGAKPGWQQRTAGDAGARPRRDNHPSRSRDGESDDRAPRRGAKPGWQQRTAGDAGARPRRDNHPSRSRDGESDDRAPRRGAKPGWQQRTAGDAGARPRRDNHPSRSRDGESDDRAPRRGAKPGWQQRTAGDAGARPRRDNHPSRPRDGESDGRTARHGAKPGWQQRAAGDAGVRPRRGSQPSQSRGGETGDRAVSRRDKSGWAKTKKPQGRARTSGAAQNKRRGTLKLPRERMPELID